MLHALQLTKAQLKSKVSEVDLEHIEMADMSQHTGDNDEHQATHRSHSGRQYASLPTSDDVTESDMDRVQPATAHSTAPPKLSLETPLPKRSVLMTLLADPVVRAVISTYCLFSFSATGMVRRPTSDGIKE